MDGVTGLIDEPSRIASEVLGGDLEGDQRIGTVFQPIVDLHTRAVTGYEALTRGPSGTSLEAPLRLFDAIGRAGARVRFDRACRDAALARAVRDGLFPPLSVFVNVEPALIEGRGEDSEDLTWRHAPDELRCIIEVTERALTDRPSELLRAIAEIRDLSWGVALDDVGVDAGSLALMSLLRPDVIKLDRSVVQGVPGRAMAEVTSAVAAQAERTGAVVIAEGVETEEHELAAIALGATLAQGYRYGRPAPLPQPLPAAGSLVRFIDHGMHDGGPTPYARASQMRTAHRGSTSVLRAMIEHLAMQAAGQGPAAVVLALRPPDVGVLADVARLAALVGIIAEEPVRLEVEHELRAAVVEQDDVLAREVAFVVVAPHFTGAVAARDIGERTGDDAPVDLCVVYDRDVVVDCARTLAARLPRRD